MTVTTVGIALIVGGALAVLFAVLLFIDLQRGLAVLAALSLFARSVVKVFKFWRRTPPPERPHRHRRHSDPNAAGVQTHERRPTRKSLSMTIRDFLPKREDD